MKKKDLVEAVSSVMMTRKESQDAVDRMLTAMKHALQAGEKVVLAEIGTLQSYIAKAKKARNPNTGKTIQIRPKRKIRFRQSKELFTKD